MSFKDTQSYKELQSDWRWIHEMDPEAAAAADQWVKEHPEEWKELEHMFKGLEQRKPNCFAVKQYKKYKLSSGVVCFKRLLNQSVRKSLKTYNLQQRKERKL